MKIKLTILVFFVILNLLSCGPPAENREYMHSRAKTISDSMANLIQTALKEAEIQNTNFTNSPSDTIVTPINKTTFVGDTSKSKNGC
jgi:hypothetical protein